MACCQGFLHAISVEAHSNACPFSFVAVCVLLVSCGPHCDAVEIVCLGWVWGVWSFAVRRSAHWFHFDTLRFLAVVVGCWGDVVPHRAGAHF